MELKRRSMNGSSNIEPGPVNVSPKKEAELMVGGESKLLYTRKYGIEGYNKSNQINLDKELNLCLVFNLYVLLSIGSHNEKGKNL
ncbi:hypothetical protein NC651_037797 [Populus alba x Populus x berolinensis]|nr:hypothetical protein NC651_037797 [Populus alba x Populus x berolinensis]